MSWVTVIWSMTASACLTLAAIYCLIWYQNRSAWAHLLFSVTAAATAAFAFCELWLMRAETASDVLAAATWAHVPLFFLLVPLTWFVRVYLGAGRLWLAWTISGLHACTALANVVMGQDVNFRNVISVRHAPLLGESVALLSAPNSITPITQFGALLILVFVADASISAWRRGDRRKALMIGGSAEFFLFAALGTAMAVLWADAPLPIAFSLFYLGLVGVMAYELSRDVLRASQLVGELQASEAGLRESEARMSLAVDAADIGIWIRDFGRHEIWASARWRELFGFGPSESLNFAAILERLHPDDRDEFEQAHARAEPDDGGGRYQTEYRLHLPDGTTRWILSQGRIERDATDRPAIVRGASRDITARKHAELAVRNLSGRLLSAQEEERRRIARELHDNVSQQMVLLALRIAAVSKLGEVPPSVLHTMRELGQLADEMSAEIHGLSHRLHSTKLELLGLVEALRGHCLEVRPQGVDAAFHFDGVPPALSRDVELCLFRIGQEALNNVVKHSGAPEAQVTLRLTGDVLVLSIADAGRGFDTTVSTVQGGLGLASMRERLRLLDGEFSVRSEPGAGTTIVARVPISKIAPTMLAGR